MLVSRAVLVFFVSVVSGLPHATNKQDIDKDHHQTLGRSQRGANQPLIPQDFKKLFVHENGSVTLTTTDVNKTIEVGGTPRCMDWAVQSVAEIVRIMTQHMDPALFYRIAESRACAGVFHFREKLTMFPEFAGRANGDCGSRCTGNCSHTCNGDGRKYENLPGLGGTTAVVQQDNVICLHWDAYDHKESILAHEFAHTVHFRLTPELKKRIKANYDNAKANQLWKIGSYAMSNELEYWAESSQVYFGVQQYSQNNAGNMNRCTDSNGDFYTCKDEVEGRENLRKIDPNQLDLLTEVYANGNSSIIHGMKICPGYTPNHFVFGHWTVQG